MQDEKSLAWATIYTIETKLNNGEYQHPDDVRAALHNAMADLEGKKREFALRVEQMNACDHTFGDPWWTSRRQLFFELMYRFEHKCTKCGYIESHECRTFNDHPTWAETATERFTNPDVL